MTIGLSQCAFCKHFDRTQPTRNVCNAFPNGIPDDILWNRQSHAEPVDGDGGIVFESRISSMRSTALPSPP
jgi:hypothetical protein